MSKSEVIHHSSGPGNNVLCLNGSAHRRSTTDKERVTCPACRKMLRTGCSAIDAIGAWSKLTYIRNNVPR